MGSKEITHLIETQRFTDRSPGRAEIPLEGSTVR